MLQLAVGRVQLTLLDDGSFPFPARYFFANVPPDVWQREVPTDATGKIDVGHNYALLRCAGDLILLDTGYGDDTHGGRTGHLLEELHRSGYRREQVTAVVNTHAHGDHTSRNTLAANRRHVATFPNARYYLGRADWERFSGPDGKIHHFDQNLRSLADAGRLTLVDGALQLAPDVTLLPTPGHTPGHMSVVIESLGAMAIYLGDVCHHPLHFSHPGWVSCFDTDPDLTPRTRDWLFRMALEHDALLVCPHAAAPGLGRLRRLAGGFAWVPVTAE
ncbi:MBL fold metallo-hydrolase [Massilia horti]|uniref:MBL fold metallo-hydrolase n=1 Tax=Massilia horti TaxID=2562153 RepID=A0A4Y9SLA1_9BURK|nr:MBL fold metallo-hydrolase [Massilia horti]TFW27318.1 MBL fold metallo-hydrolase [Massilia horti]